MSLSTSSKGSFLVGVKGVSCPGKIWKSRAALLQFGAFWSTFNSRFQRYFLTLLSLVQSCCWVYNKVGGSRGLLPRENLNFQNLRKAIYCNSGTDICVNTDAVTFKLFWWPSPLYTPYFSAAPPPWSHIFWHDPLPPKKWTATNVFYFFTVVWIVLEWRCQSANL